MRIVVTGAAGFLGRHVTSLLRQREDVTVTEVTRATSREACATALRDADAVIHLAGINRPQDESEFVTGNVDFTRHVVDTLAASGQRATIVLSSTSRAEEDTPYGRSKIAAERLVEEYAQQAGSTAVIYRLPNIFGKWSRPNYNSAVATFCHNVTRDLPIEVHDSSRRLSLVYAEDVAHALIAGALRARATGRAERAAVTPVYERTLGEIATLVRQFRALRTELVLPDFSDGFVQKLYSTYVSFLPLAATAYPLKQFQDDRGALAELLKSPWFGQVFVSRTKPGITRGNHWHQTKTEKFVVVEGDAVIRIRPIEGGEVTEIPVSGHEFRVVDIPPGHTHNITNVGTGELVTMFWSSEIFDRERPDTYPMNV